MMNSSDHDKNYNGQQSWRLFQSSWLLIERWVRMSIKNMNVKKLLLLLRFVREKLVFKPFLRILFLRILFVGSIILSNVVMIIINGNAIQDSNRQPAAAILYAQDLWNNNQGFFTPAQQLPLGTIIEVMFDDDFDFRYDLEASKGKLGEYNDISVLKEFLLPLLGNRGNALEGTRDISIRSRERLSGSIGAVITAYNPANKTYTLNVAREINLNNEDRGQLNFAAQVNGNHISEDQTISATKLANLTLFYENRQDTITFTEDDFEKLNFPTQDEIAAVRKQIKDIKRQRRETAEQEAAQLLQEQLALQSTTPLTQSPPDQSPSSPEQETIPNNSSTPTTINTNRSVTNQIIGQIPRNNLQSVTNQIIVREPIEGPEDDLPAVPEIEIELTETKKREIFLQLLNIFIDDWF
ncbi:hypothetical protein COTS27_00716 [Spirochaetota bacterium]|nr:hypothetical protein COTS27_00716 [Spirochaetota bacterium]